MDVLLDNFRCSWIILATVGSLQSTDQFYLCCYILYDNVPFKAFARDTHYRRRIDISIAFYHEYE